MLTLALFAILQCEYYAAALHEHAEAVAHGDEHAIAVVEMYQQSCYATSVDQLGAALRITESVQLFKNGPIINRFTFEKYSTVGPKRP